MNKSDIYQEKMLIYKQEFEKRVMIPCYENGIFTKKIPVSTKWPKLMSTEFGQVVGQTFEYGQILVFNYYGLNKFSTGFLREIGLLRTKGFDVKSVNTVVVYFAAIKMANITNFAPDLTNGFTEFKEYLVGLRDFPTSREA